MKRSRLLMMLPMLLVLLAGALTPPSTAHAQQEEKDRLQQRFRERFPQLQRLKRDGKVGETHLGYVEAVTAEHRAEEGVAKLIDAENTDRRRLYEILAAELDTTPLKIAERNARRNFDNARKGEWLKYPDGWRQKS